MLAEEGCQGFDEVAAVIAHHKDRGVVVSMLTKPPYMRFMAAFGEDAYANERKKKEQDTSVDSFRRTVNRL